MFGLRLLFDCCSRCCLVVCCLVTHFVHTFTRLHLFTVVDWFPAQLHFTFTVYLLLILRFTVTFGYTFYVVYVCPFVTVGLLVYILHVYVLVVTVTFVAPVWLFVTRYVYGYGWLVAIWLFYGSHTVGYVVCYVCVCVSRWLFGLRLFGWLLITLHVVVTFYTRSRLHLRLQFTLRYVVPPTVVWFTFVCSWLVDFTVVYVTFTLFVVTHGCAAF